MGINAKSQCFWWVFPCFQPSTKSGRVPGSPPVSGMCCGAHLTQWISLEGQQVGRCHAFVFLGRVKEYYIFLVFLDPTCAFTSSDAHFAIRILKCASPSSTAPKTAKAFTLGFFLKRNSLFDFLLSLLLLAFPGCFSFHYHSMGVNFSGAQNRIRMQLCVVLAFVMQSSCFCQQFFFYSIFHQPWLLLQIWLQLENNYFSIARA